MSKYARIECDRCGVSVETRDGSTPAPDYYRLHETFADHNIIDICPSCRDQMNIMMDERRVDWNECLCRWIAEGQAAKGATK